MTLRVLMAPWVARKNRHPTLTLSRSSSNFCRDEKLAVQPGLLRRKMYNDNTQCWPLHEVDENNFTIPSSEFQTYRDIPYSCPRRGELRSTDFYCVYELSKGLFFMLEKKDKTEGLLWDRSAPPLFWHDVPVLCIWNIRREMTLIVGVLVLWQVL